MSQLSRRIIISVDEWVGWLMVAWLRYRGDHLWWAAALVQVVAVYGLSYIPYWIRYDPWWRFAWAKEKQMLEQNAALAQKIQAQMAAVMRGSNAIETAYGAEATRVGEMEAIRRAKMEELKRKMGG